MKKNTTTKAKALLSIVNEFRRCQDNPIQIDDLCSALVICVYQESRACEQAASEFAESAGIPGGAR